MSNRSFFAKGTTHTCTCRRSACPTRKSCVSQFSLGGRGVWNTCEVHCKTKGKVAAIFGGKSRIFVAFFLGKFKVDGHRMSATVTVVGASRSVRWCEHPQFFDKGITQYGHQEDLGGVSIRKFLTREPPITSRGILRTQVV